MKSILCVLITLSLLTACGGSSDSTDDDQDNSSVDTPVNNSPIGTVSISGELVEGEILTADIDLVDSDGLGEITLQWLRADQEIDGATSNNYLILAADIENQIALRVSYTDGSGNLEVVTSALTAVIASNTPVTKSNILLIIADDLGLDASAQYSLSSDLPNTPTLNDIASKGLVFDIVNQFAQYAQNIRRNGGNNTLDITNTIRSANCSDYANEYRSSVQNQGNNVAFEGSLEISVILINVFSAPM